MCECERSSRNVIVFQRAVRMSLIVQRIMTAVAALSVPVLIAACGARSTNSSNETFRKGERFCFLPLAVVRTKLSFSECAWPTHHHAECGWFVHAGVHVVQVIGSSRSKQPRTVPRWRDCCFDAVSYTHLTLPT